MLFCREFAGLAAGFDTTGSINCSDLLKKSESRLDAYQE